MGSGKPSSQAAGCKARAIESWAPEIRPSAGFRPAIVASLGVPWREIWLRWAVVTWLRTPCQDSRLTLLVFTYGRPPWRGTAASRLAVRALPLA